MLGEFSNGVLLVSSLQSIGNVGPAVAIFVMLSSQSPAGASLWLTLALGLSAFTQAGFLVNYQVNEPVLSPSCENNPEFFVCKLAFLIPFHR